MGAFPVRQGDGDIGAVREAIRRLQDGAALVLFPEGSRSEDGELQPLQAGVGLIAKKAGVPVVPCIIDGSQNAWPLGAKFFRRRPMWMRFGPPLNVDRQKASAIVENIDETFHRMMCELREDVAAEREMGVRTMFSRRHLDGVAV